MERFLWVCLGGAVGSGARFLMSSFVFEQLGSRFPYATLSVNLLGSFMLGGLVPLTLAAGTLSTAHKLALTTGLMGGFTTYSTFSYETVQLLEQGAYAMAALNVAITVIACLGACFLGFHAGRWLTTG